MLPNFNFHSVNGGIVGCVCSGECRVDSVSICSCVSGVNHGGDVSNCAVRDDSDNDVGVNGG